MVTRLKFFAKWKTKHRLITAKPDLLYPGAPSRGSLGRAGEGNAVGSPTGFQHPVRWKDYRERKTSSSTRQACSSGSPEGRPHGGTRRGSTRTQRTALSSLVLAGGLALLRLCWLLRTTTTRTTSTTTKSPPQTLMRATQNRVITPRPIIPRTFFRVIGKAPTRRQLAAYGLSFLRQEDR